MAGDGMGSGVQFRPRSQSLPTPGLSRTSSSDSLSGTSSTDTSSPLSSHTATQGTRNTSVLSRVGNFFKSLFSSVVAFFGDIGAKLKALGKGKAEEGERTESRRDNAERSPGPRTEVRERERTRTQSVDGSGSPPPLGDDDDEDTQPRRLSGGNGPDAPRLDPHTDDDDLPPGDDDSGSVRRTRSRAGGEGDLRPGIVLAAKTRALEDPDLAGLSTDGDSPELDGGKLIDFMGKHSLATSSPGFWATQPAKDNVATLGGALAFSILDKVKTAGQLTAQDRTEFMRALQLVPRDPSLPPLDGIADDMLGALDEDAFDQLLNSMIEMFMGVYGGSDSTHPLPGADYFDNIGQDGIDRATTGLEKLDRLRSAFVASISDQMVAPDSMEPETVKEALEAMR